MVKHTSIITGQTFDRPIYPISSFVANGIDIKENCILFVFCEKERLLSISKCSTGILNVISNNKMSFYFDVLIMVDKGSHVLNCVYDNFMTQWVVGKNKAQILKEVKNN